MGVEGEGLGGGDGGGCGGGGGGMVAVQRDTQDVESYLWLLGLWLLNWCLLEWWFWNVCGNRSCCCCGRFVVLESFWRLLARN